MVMGIINVTPDSFFASARTEHVDDAIARGLVLFAEGADIVDVGGESTRPGASPVRESEELLRVIPVIEGLAGRGRISIDTTKEGVARAAVVAGASMINDVSGTLAYVAAELEVAWVAMHAKGIPATMQDDPHYGDVVSEVAEWLEAHARLAREAGVGELWLDPGIGFGKTFEHNWALLAHLDYFSALADRFDAGLTVGTSRKQFLGELGRTSLGPEDRLEGSIATAVAAYEAGARMVRVHDVAVTVQAMRIVLEEVDVS
jgi:dihydropteroate synthase